MTFKCHNRAKSLWSCDSQIASEPLCAIIHFKVHEIEIKLFLIYQGNEAGNKQLKLYFDSY